MCSFMVSRVAITVIDDVANNGTVTVYVAEDGPLGVVIAASQQKWEGTDDKLEHELGIFNVIWVAERTMKLTTETNR